MAANQQNGELPEFTMRGPFGGIQSEMSLESIEGSGFADCENIMFRQGKFAIRPKFDTTYVPQVRAMLRIMDLVGTISAQAWTMETPQYRTGVFDPLVGVADFFNSQGNRIQVIFTPTTMRVYSGGAWGVPAAYFSAGTVAQRFSTAIVGEKLCFSQGIDPVGIWDGFSATLERTDTPVPAKYLAEVANHLILANTLENGSRAYQRLRWSATGDPTDLTSLSAGQVDLFNDLGPINGVLKLYQYGYVFQQLGIVQCIPTGVGTSPFDFIPLSAHSKGLTCPGSLAAFGETACYYVGKDNIYTFDGTMSNPIGDFPVDNRRRFGARSRILADVIQCDPSKILGLITTSVNGKPFPAYWVIIPGVSIWVFNVDEGNWTRWTLDGIASATGIFTLKAPVRICDLIGAIAIQMWTPATLTNDNPFDCVMVGMTDGSLGIFDFNGLSEKDAYIETGQLAFGDYRHEKQLVKIRTITQDEGITTVELRCENEKGQEWGGVWPFRRVTVGSGTGKSRADVHAPNLPGRYFTFRINIPKECHFSCSELSFIYSPSGELRMDANASTPSATRDEASMW